MTGEITLRGDVLPVGGIKEKVLAAHRAGIHHVILPHVNEKDLPDIPEPVRESMEFHLVSAMPETSSARKMVLPLRSKKPIGSSYPLTGARSNATSTPATTATATNDTGRKTFQPRRISWS